MPRSRRGLWVGRGVCLLLVLGLVTYLIMIGLERADKVASSVAAVLALLALFAPYLVRPGGAGKFGGAPASGAASVAIGGHNAGDVTTEASGVPVPPDGVSASGPASVSIGGRNKGRIFTKYEGRGE